MTIAVRTSAARSLRRVSEKLLCKFRDAAESAVTLLYPLRCPVCDDVVGGGERIHIKCLGKMKILTSPWCLKCGRKVESGESLCDDCRTKEHFFCRGRALYEYDTAAESIYRFKYSGRREYGDAYAEQMEDFLGEFIRSVRPDAIIPIPMYGGKKRRRGYNQAEVLAVSLGKRMEIPVYRNFLKRVRNTRPLKELNPRERQNNLKNAFIITDNDVELRVTILIDDIYTTGATLDEAARTLLAAGTEKVYFLSLACGRGV